MEGLTVIEQSSQEREQEIIDLFNKIKPLLDKGHSYSSALKAIDPSLVRSRAIKKVKEYGETQGYPKSNYSRRTQYLIPKSRKNKYGLHNVILIKNPMYLSEYIWRYNYYENNKLKTISRPDLRELRQIVEEKNLEWKVTDLVKARDAYELNRIIQENTRLSKNENSSGIYRVFKGHCPRCNQGFTWRYVNSSDEGNVYLSSVDLNVLKKKVLEAGEDWIVRDEDKAKANGLKIEGK